MTHRFTFDESSDDDSVQLLLKEISDGLKDIYHKYPILRTSSQSFDNNKAQVNNNSLRKTSSKASSVAKKSVQRNVTKKKSQKGVNKLVRPAGSIGSGINLMQLLNEYKTVALAAYEKRQIFIVYQGYDTIRRALLERGWIEKILPEKSRNCESLSYKELLQFCAEGNDYERILMSKILLKFPAFFIWQINVKDNLFAEVSPYRNRIRRRRKLDFSTKIGLIGCAEKEMWYRIDGISGMNYPRFFRLHDDFDERQLFIENYRLTQCSSLIRFLLKNLNQSSKIYDKTKGTVPSDIIDFALDRLEEQVGTYEHVDVVSSNTLTACATEFNWNEFFEDSNAIIYNNAKLRINSKLLFAKLRKGKAILKILEEKQPDLKWDGYHNLWIVKPGSSSRGHGITVKNSLSDILEQANNDSRNYIVQKYIERPMIIYKTKFDIRMYMLLTIKKSSVCIWMYKDCYMRFCTHEFSLTDLREEIHLTNNSVQKRYKNFTDRDERLPPHNMWSLQQFKEYLRNQHINDAIWDTKIYPGFKKNLIPVVLISLEDTELTKNCFELYGCDFMLDVNFEPILIEINSLPDVSSSTTVTAALCPMVLRDVVKVVVDLPTDAHASTGLFELVLKTNYTNGKTFPSDNTLSVIGEPMTINESAYTKLANEKMKQMQKLWMYEAVMPRRLK